MRLIKYMHHKLESGRMVTIGYEFDTSHKGEVKIAFAFKSEKDEFSRKIAQEIIKQKFESQDYISVYQTEDIHIMAIVISVWNKFKESHLPNSWKKHNEDWTIIPQKPISPDLKFDIMRKVPVLCNVVFHTTFTDEIKDFSTWQLFKIVLGRLFRV